MSQKTVETPGRDTFVVTFTKTMTAAITISAANINEAESIASQLACHPGITWHQPATPSAPITVSIVTAQDEATLAPEKASLNHLFEEEEEKKKKPSANLDFLFSEDEYEN